MMRTIAAPYAAGAIGLGLLGLLFGDFALQWQPVPADLPGRQVLAYLSGLILISAGIAALIPRTSALGGLIFAGVYGLWVLVLHLPGALASPSSVAAWLGLFEILALASAGLMLFAIRSPGRRETLRRTAQLVFGACPLIFGLSHFVYADFTATMVPAWMPAPMFWAIATGLGHVAAGLAILLGIWSRLAATALAAMCASFVVLLHLPRVIAAPGIYAEWVMLGIALSITGAAWIISFGVQDSKAMSRLLPNRANRRLPA